MDTEVGSACRRNQSVLLGKHSLVQVTGPCAFREEERGAPLSVVALSGSPGLCCSSHYVSRREAAAGTEVGIAVIAQSIMCLIF